MTKFFFHTFSFCTFPDSVGTLKLFIQSVVSALCHCSVAWHCRQFCPQATVVMGIGKGGLAPLVFENVSKKVVFLVSRGKKTNFTTFCPLLKKFWKKSPRGPSWKRSFRRPWMRYVQVLQVWVEAACNIFLWQKTSDICQLFQNISF